MILATNHGCETQNALGLATETSSSKEDSLPRPDYADVDTVKSQVNAIAMPQNPTVSGEFGVARFVAESR